MVTCYTGTPGSGKSLHSARAILRMLNSGCRVICNFPINMAHVKKKWRKNFYYLPDSELTPHYLFEFAKAYHNKKAENQTFIFIDEAQRLFPIDRIYPRRKEWEQFFQLHRHWGYSVVLVTQNMGYINKGIRIQSEYEIKHRKVNNYGLGGLILTLLHITLFASITFWMGTKERVSSEFFTYSRRLGSLYDTFSNFDTAFSEKAPDRIQKKEEPEEIIVKEISSEEERQEMLNTVFGKPLDEMEDDPEDKEEVDADSIDFDEDNIESWGDELYISEKDLEKWKTA